MDTLISHTEGIHKQTACVCITKLAQKALEMLDKLGFQILDKCSITKENKYDWTKVIVTAISINRGNELPVLDSSFLVSSFTLQNRKPNVPIFEMG